MVDSRSLFLRTEAWLVPADTPPYSHAFSVISFLLLVLLAFDRPRTTNEESGVNAAIHRLT
jgi:hypothetical protein